MIFSVFIHTWVDYVGLCGWQDVDTSVMDAKMGDIIAYVESIKEATEAVANATDKLLKAEKEVSRELCAGSEQYASLGGCLYI